jgi:hypothetical protein
MMKRKFLAVCLIGVLMAVGLVLMSCGGGCPRRAADCRPGNACGNYNPYGENTCIVNDKCDC